MTLDPIDKADVVKYIAGVLKHYGVADDRCDYLAERMVNDGYHIIWAPVGDVAKERDG